MIWVPHPYQETALEHVLQNPLSVVYAGPKTGLWLEMGLGKTVVAETAVDILQMAGAVNKALVVAPLRVAQSVWSQEAAKWDHLKHLTFSHILGTEAQRIAAINKPADIHIINRENIPWLVARMMSCWPWDMVLLDESSSFKDPSSKRFRALKSVSGYIKRMIQLTGTPAGNGLLDIWAQIYLLDRGERFYPTVTQYRTRYFHQPDPVLKKYMPLKGADEIIFEKLQGMVISMKNTDYLKLPERIETEVPVYFDAKLQDSYDQFERDQVMAISEEVDITAFNAGALCTKLLQFSSGAVYDSDQVPHWIHDHKLDALAEIIDSAAGKPVLVFYHFKHSADRIIKRFGAKMIRGDKDVLAWNRREIDAGLLHAQSAYGLNMQEGSNIIVWYDLTWSLQDYEQANARLHRQGQKENVYIYHIICHETMDQDVLKALKKKHKVQSALMEAVKAKVRKYREKSLI